MRVISPRQYAEWRSAPIGTWQFQETIEDCPLTERFLQMIWQHQRLLRDQLRTLDGRPIRILHPGFWNREAGPDFRGALVQFGDEPACSGDVEIDLETGGWRAHRHHINASYARVILHVVWDGADGDRAGLPTLALKGFLDTPLKQLKRWLGRTPLKRVAEGVKGECFAPLRQLPAENFLELLRQAALVRLEVKGAEFEARARQVGWEQSLWEGMFGGLGYKHNVWAMRRVAELLPIVREGSGSVVEMQAVLLGVAGMLPGEVGAARAREYVRSLWDIWWRRREQYGELILPAAIWRLHGIRPANHPQRRLALAAHWVAAGDLAARIEGWFGEGVADRDLLSSLVRILQPDGDDFWLWHWTLKSKRLCEPAPMLGGPRATDLAMNVILPWLWVRAAAGKNEELQRAAEHRYFRWPRAEDNAVLRLARQRLFGNDDKPFFRTAAAQQGLLQIVRDFCDQSNARCDDCQFPQLVKQLEF